MNEQLGNACSRHEESLRNIHPHVHIPKCPSVDEQSSTPTDAMLIGESINLTGPLFLRLAVTKPSPPPAPFLFECHRMLRTLRRKALIAELRKGSKKLK